MTELENKPIFISGKHHVGRSYFIRRPETGKVWRSEGSDNSKQFVPFPTKFVYSSGMH